MKKHVRIQIKYLLAFAFIIAGVGCSKLGQDIAIPDRNGPVSKFNSRTITIDYDGMVDTINTLVDSYFADEDFDDLDFTFFWNQAAAIDPLSVVDTSDLKVSVRRALLGVQYTGLSGTLASFASITAIGSTIINDLKDDFLYALNHSASYSTIQTLLQDYAEEAIENEQLNAFEQGTIFLTCVMLESGLNPSYEWSNFTGNHSSSREDCNLGDILVDLAVGASIQAILAATGIIDDPTNSELGAGIDGVFILTQVLHLTSAITVFLTVGSAVIAILRNCWEVISDFFTDVWHGILDWADKIFGEGIDCFEPGSLLATLLDCAGNRIQIDAVDAGQDIVAYDFTGINTIPSHIISSTRYAVFEPTDNNFEITVFGICSDGSESDEEQDEWSVSNIIATDQATDFEFNEVHGAHYTNINYFFYISALPNALEHLSWTAGSGVTIVDDDDDWVKVIFGSTGLKTVTGRITNTCNSSYKEHTLSVTVL